MGYGKVDGKFSTVLETIWQSTTKDFNTEAKEANTEAKEANTEEKEANTEAKEANTEDKEAKTDSRRDYRLFRMSFILTSTFMRKTVV